ncbi:MAG TPA: YicC/YloC family endoribonuclease [Terriglobia bacterium]|nr:YicC/YloC family endoribonuclease [Terriglobia bacterium]
MSAGPTQPRCRLRSMTGYAAAVVQQDGFTLTVSLRSVNHRYLDLRTHLPEALLPLEREARSLVQAKNPRGHVDLKAALDFSGGGDVVVDEALAGKYVEIFRRLGAAYGLPEPLDAATLAQLPGVVSRKGLAAAGEVSPELGAAFRAALQEAVERWDAMRAEEASLLAQDLSARLTRLEHATLQAEQWLRESLPEAQRRLAERLQALAAPSGIDPARLAQEAMLLADRTDPTEEIQRMKAHVSQFAAVLRGEADAGRKLDFLLQEMHRETNTLLSKTAGLGAASLPVTNLALEMKAEVEKLREQVQNLQ